MNCEKCQKVHDGSYASGRFCSSSCAKSYATALNRDDISEKLRVNRFCKKCDSAFRDKASRSAYCRNCRKHSKKYDEASFEELLTDRNRKRRLIEERGWRCEGCNLETWLSQRIPLQLDHIDGNSGNSVKINLRLLCANCHALTPTFAGKNKGKAQGKFRKEGRSKYYNRIPRAAVWD